MAKPDKDPPPSDSAKSSGPEPNPEVQTGGWDDRVKVRLRQFNGPAGADEALRIAMTKEAYADLVGHAKESLDREICGVLLGDLCEDEYGRFLDITATLRGGAAKGGGTHVTFTQDTWNEIHAAKDERFPKLQIVGWYHSHPGFGVEFSDMDLFIQKNFFGGPGQIAFVSDPLGGQEAIVANANGAITPVKRFWVDGRERRCYVPRDKDNPDQHAEASSDLTKSVQDLQDRVRQLTDAVEKQRGTFYSLLTFLGTLAAFAILAVGAYYIWKAYTAKPINPEEVVLNLEPIPIVSGGRPVLWVVGNNRLQDIFAQMSEYKAKAERWDKEHPATAPATPSASGPAAAPATSPAPHVPVAAPPAATAPAPAH